MTRRSGQRPWPVGLRLLLFPVACCGGPRVVAGLAAAGMLARDGLALAVLLAGAMLVIRLRRRVCAAAQRERGARQVRGRCPDDYSTMTACEHAAAKGHHGPDRCGL